MSARGHTGSRKQEVSDVQPAHVALLLLNINAAVISVIQLS